MKQAKNKKGYPIVYLRKNGKSHVLTVHRLVATAFIPNPDNKPQVNHIDGNKTNNYVDNLEWCTNSENMDHAIRMGLFENSRSPYCGKPKRKVMQINPNTEEVIKIYQSISEAAQATNQKNGSNIGSCCRGNRNIAGGYKWKYV